MDRREEIERITKSLTDDLVQKGMIIEAGWVALRHLTYPPDTPKMQLDELRSAFFAGAQHLFSSIMSVLDPGEDATDADVNRMELIAAELQNFIKNYELRNLPTRGSG